MSTGRVNKKDLVKTSWRETLIQKRIDLIAVWHRRKDSGRQRPARQCPHAEGSSRAMTPFLMAVDFSSATPMEASQRSRIAKVSEIIPWPLESSVVYLHFLIYSAMK